MKVEHRWLGIVGIVLVTVLVGVVIAVLALTDDANEVFSPNAPAAVPVEPTPGVSDPEPEAVLEVPRDPRMGLGSRRAAFP